MCNSMHKWEGDKITYILTRCNFVYLCRIWFSNVAVGSSLGLQGLLCVGRCITHYFWHQHCCHPCLHWWCHRSSFWHLHHLHPPLHQWCHWSSFWHLHRLHPTLHQWCHQFHWCQRLGVVGVAVTASASRGWAGAIGACLWVIGVVGCCVVLYNFAATFFALGWCVNNNVVVLLFAFGWCSCHGWCDCQLSAANVVVLLLLLCACVWCFVVVVGCWRMFGAECCQVEFYVACQLCGGIECIFPYVEI